MRSWEALLGMSVITGDGREWVVSSITPADNFVVTPDGKQQESVRLPTTVRLLPVVWKTADGRPNPLDLPLSVFIGALDFGLIEEV